MLSYITEKILNVVSIDTIKIYVYLYSSTSQLIAIQ